MPRHLPLLGLLLALAAPARAEEPFLLRDGQRVLFLGDSNTFAGRYIACIEGYLATRLPGQRFTLINLGLPSETVSGLSEPDHPFPRPNVHDRLERALTKIRPDLVVACYGMNDGIYYPPSPERQERYQQGITRLVEQVRRAGPRLVLMTPAPFDPVPLMGKTLGDGAEKYSWMRPYRDYDRALGGFSRWLRSLEKDLPVVDLHTAVNRHLEKVRKDEPGYFLAGDGIHPNPSGHWLMARTILEAWKAPDTVARARVDLTDGRVLDGKGIAVMVGNATTFITWKMPRPLPPDPAWDAHVTRQEQDMGRLSRIQLSAVNIPFPTYGLYEGDTLLGKVTRAELMKGIDLSRLTRLSVNRPDEEFWKLLDQRQKVLGLAWLDEVGHTRPQTPRGKPLAEAQKEAARLEEQIRARSGPVQLTLRLLPVD